MATELRHRCEICGQAMHKHCDRCDWQTCSGCGVIWSERRGLRRSAALKKDA